MKIVHGGVETRKIPGYPVEGVFVEVSLTIPNPPPPPSKSPFTTYATWEEEETHWKPIARDIYNVLIDTCCFRGELAPHVIPEILLRHLQAAKNEIATELTKAKYEEERRLTPS